MSPEHKELRSRGIIEIYYNDTTINWIHILEESLRSPSEYVLTPKLDNNTQHETAVLYLPNLGFEPENHTALTITRNVVNVNANRKFRIDLRVERHGEEKIFYHPHILKIEVNTEEKRISFFGTREDEESSQPSSQPIITLFASGKTKPELFAFQVMD